MGRRNIQGSPQVVLFNGPAGSGKDYAAKILMDFHKAEHFSFKSMVEMVVINLYGLDMDDWYFWMSSQEEKGKSRVELNGMSARECLIYVSEDMIKPHFGKDWIATTTAKTVSAINPHSPLLVCSDLGFQEELDASITQWGYGNVHLVLLQREGHTFKGDSRSYVKPPKELFDNVYLIRNEGDHKFSQHIHQLAMDIMDL